MKIYTKTGDDGTTGLIGGSRVLKSDAAIECYGTVDELNAAIGVANCVADRETASELRAVQAELFVIGSHLATPTGESRASSLPKVDPAWVARLESQIDLAESKLEPLRNFILPGGTELAARLHLARTICRRAERLQVARSTQHAVDDAIVVYMNRLSDWLFVQARLANKRAGQPDIPWISQ